MSNLTPPTHGGRFISLCTQCTLCLQAYVVYVHVHVDDSAKGVLAGKYIKAAQENIFRTKIKDKGNNVASNTNSVKVHQRQRHSFRGA